MKLPECKCEGLFKSYYFEAIDNNHKLRVENEKLRNEIKSYEETLEIYGDSKLMKHLMDIKKNGLPLKDCISLKDLDVKEVKDEVKKNE